MKKIVWTIIWAALAAGGCRKDRPAPDLHARLQAHAWRLLSLTDNGKPYQLENCQLDDRQVYLDKTGYDDRGALKCSGKDPQQSPFTYTVLPDGQTISVTEG